MKNNDIFDEIRAKTVRTDGTVDQVQRNNEWAEAEIYKRYGVPQGDIEAVPDDWQIFEHLIDANEAKLNSQSILAKIEKMEADIAFIKKFITWGSLMIAFLLGISRMNIF